MGCNSTYDMKTNQKSMLALVGVALFPPSSAQVQDQLHTGQLVARVKHEMKYQTSCTHRLQLETARYSSCISLAQRMQKVQLYTTVVILKLVQSDHEIIPLY